MTDGGNPFYAAKEEEGGVAQSWSNPPASQYKHRRESRHRRGQRKDQKFIKARRSFTPLQNIRSLMSLRLRYDRWWESLSSMERGEGWCCIVCAPSSCQSIWASHRMWPKMNCKEEKGNGKDKSLFRQEEGSLLSQTSEA